MSKEFQYSDFHFYMFICNFLSQFVLYINVCSIFLVHFLLIGELYRSGRVFKQMKHVLFLVWQVRFPGGKDLWWSLIVLKHVIHWPLHRWLRFLVHSVTFHKSVGNWETPSFKNRGVKIPPKWGKRLKLVHDWIPTIEQNCATSHRWFSDKVLVLT